MAGSTLLQWTHDTYPQSLGKQFVRLSFRTQYDTPFFSAIRFTLCQTINDNARHSGEEGVQFKCGPWWRDDGDGVCGTRIVAPANGRRWALIGCGGGHKVEDIEDSCVIRRKEKRVLWCG